MSIEIQDKYDCVYVLHCEGSLVPGPELEYLQTRLDEIKRLACTRLLIDFQDVAAIGSIGVTFIVGAYSSVTGQPGGCIVLTGVNQYVRQVLDLTRLSTLIPLASDLAAGLAILRAEPPLPSLSLSNCSTAKYKQRSKPSYRQTTVSCGSRLARFALRFSGPRACHWAVHSAG